MKSRAFDPPLKVVVGDGLTLYVKGATTDRTGLGVAASIEVWNDKLCFQDLVHLSNDLARRRCARAVEEAGSGYATAKQVLDVLLPLANQVEQKLRAEDVAPGEAPTERTPETVDSLHQQAQPLLADPQLLDRAYATLGALGLVGERRTALTTFLAAVSRLLERPVSVIIKGPSSGGKSFTLERVLALLPPSAFVNYTSVSPKYLAYSTDDLRHRIVVLFEASGVAGDMGAYIMRSLLSEGRLHIGTVEKAEDGSIASREVVKEGPTALFTTTTRHSIDAELETRALPLSVDDDPKHSAAILQRAAAAFTGNEDAAPDLAPWHALQDWLDAAGERRVRIPYAPTLAALVPCRSVRIRRDIGKLLTLICACAVLHQEQRDRAGDGAIVASLDDYATVRDLMAEFFAVAQSDGLTQPQRQAVEAVTTLCDEAGAHETGVPLARVAERLGLDKSAASRRLSNPLKLGFLKNLETRKVGHHQAMYVPGEPLPALVTVLPLKEAVAGLREVDL